MSLCHVPPFVIHFLFWGLFRKVPVVFDFQPPEKTISIFVCLKSVLKTVD